MPSLPDSTIWRYKDGAKAGAIGRDELPGLDITQMASALRGFPVSDER